MEELDTDDYLDGDNREALREKQNEIMMKAAEHATAGFENAARNSVPCMCHEGRLRDLSTEYTHLPIMSGLIRDMEHATSSRQSMFDEWSGDGSYEAYANDSTYKASKKKLRIPKKWCAKLVSVGLNYLQGWLAIQGIRKAAADRDKMLPKFPLF